MAAKTGFLARFVPLSDCPGTRFLTIFIMPIVTLIAEKTIVYARQMEVSDAELAEIQARLRPGDQEGNHLLAEDFLGEEEVVEDNGYEAVRLVLG